MQPAPLDTSAPASHESVDGTNKEASEWVEMTWITGMELTPYWEHVVTGHWTTVCPNEALRDVPKPVIGGHAGTTILPLFSQVPATASLSAEQITALDKHVQDAGAGV